MTKLGADMRDFLNESDLTERRTFIKSFVKEIVVMPGDALLRYAVPMPDDSLIPGRDAEEVALPGSVLSTIHDGGHGRTRTNDLSLIRTALEPTELQAHVSLNYQTCPVTQSRPAPCHCEKHSDVAIPLHITPKNPVYPVHPCKNPPPAHPEPVAKPSAIP